MDREHFTVGELARQNELLTQVLSLAGLGFYDLDLIGNSLYWNDALYRMFGEEPGSFEPSYERFLGYVHPEDRERVDSLFYDLMVHNRDTGLQYRIIKRDGSIAELDVSIRMEADPDGSPSRMLGTVRDITETVTYRDELLRKNRLLEETQRIVKLGFWEFDVPKDRLLWSDEVYRIFGLEPQSLAATYEKFLTFVHPDDREMLNQVYQGSLEQKTSYDVRHRVVRADGSVIHVREQAYHEYDAGGKPVRSIGTVLDITDTVAYEERLDQKRKQLEHIQQVANLGSYEYDIVHGELSWSREMYELFGVDPQQYTPSYEGSFSRVHPEDRERVEGVLKAALKDGKPGIQGQYRILRDDGTVIYVKGDVNLLYNEDGVPVKAIGTTQDITVLEESRQALKERNDLLSLAQRMANLGYWSFDIARRHLEWSDELYRIFGMDPETDTASVEKFVRMIHPEDRKMVIRTILASEHKEEQQVRHRLLKPGGSVLHVNAVIHTEFDAAGKAVRNVGSFQDITGIVKNELEMQRLKEQLESVVNKIPDILYSFRIDGAMEVVYINDAVKQITGYPASDFIGNRVRNFESIIHPEDTPRIKRIIDYALTHHEVYFLEYRIIAANGEIIHVADTGQVVAREGESFLLEGTISDTSIHKDYNKRFTKFLDLQDNIIILTDGERPIFLNTQCFEFLGYESQKAFMEEHQCITELFIEESPFFYVPDDKKFGNEWVTTLIGLNDRQRIVAMKDKYRIPHVFAITVNSYDQDYYILNFTDVSENFSEKLRLEQIAITDTLTGAYNREFYQMNIERLIADHAKEAHLTGFTIFDLDHFKLVNDTWGHDVGDSVLRKVIKVVGSHLRKDDRLIRWGGDEFLIITRADTLSSVYAQAELLRSQLEQTAFDTIGSQTCTFGCAVHAAGEAPEATMKAADRALYRAKEVGRNRVESAG